ncbi:MULTISPECIES: hypothetical protein [unclassified Neisseria]|uniref:NUDIX hydrolase n=1 Tax=unclassified Neisseria TaxID=2623750 RepID=UPI0026671DC3|nr:MULTISPECIES: hypothetical protein [unclassified Neisseria]MDO1509770.1 hypothetical protein [Neisseria sp. MVDL19-042950]MDO1515906.1 hypothetical protein [Neisseria sp. MVDL18-041461]MDO1563019.1 hypothetical protein [Neisseria sp. MVDL20-010259]
MDSFPETDGNTEGLVELVAVLIAVTDGQPRVLTVDNGNLLLNGPLLPVHRSLQAGVRVWVAKKTGQPMGYVEQLYTFLDTNCKNGQGLPVLYVSYLGLVREANENILSDTARWCDWYAYFPRENTCHPDHEQIIAHIVQHIRRWANTADTEATRRERLNRMNLCWGLEPYEWSEEYVLLRYELLYESGLIHESPEPAAGFDLNLTGKAMAHDHRRVLATAMSRLRAKIKYRPIIYELLPPQFTLLQLQQSIEALIGLRLHKQNFRRQIKHQDLIEPVPGNTVSSIGRPAQLYRFKDNILLESPISDIKLPLRK